MSAKLYREIIRFINNQNEVIRSFERECSASIDVNTQTFINSLYENISLLRTRTNEILDKAGSDKNE